MIALLGTAAVALAVLLGGALAGGITEHVTGSQDKGVTAFVFVYTVLAAFAVTALA